MSNNELLRTESIGKLLIRFSVPAIVGMLVMALYNVVDRMYIGRIGAIAMTGIGISLPFMTLLMAFSMLVGIGAGARISIRLGQGRQDDANRILGNAFVLLIIIMLIITVIGLVFKTQLLYLFGASEATIDFADQYIRIILIGALFQGLGFGMNNIIRAEGNPKIAMFTMLIGAITNIVLDPILIFGFGMGISGAALATITSQLVSMVWVLHHFFKTDKILRLKRENMKLDFEVVISIFSIGMSPFFMQVAASIVTMVSNNVLRQYGGDIAISAMTVVNAVAIFFLMPIFGINQGSQPIIGYNYGAKAYDRVKRALTLAILAATAITLFGFVMTQFFTQTMIHMFNNETELVEVASFGMKRFLLMMPLIGFQIVSANYFQAVGKAPRSMFLSLLRQVIVLIPMLVILPHFFGLAGVWSAGPTADFTASVVTAIFLVYEMRHLDTSHKAQQSLSDVSE